MTTKPWTKVHLGQRSVEVLRLDAPASIAATRPGTVLFLHGWGLSPRSYAAPLTTLAAHGLDVFAPSLPGFGLSDPLSLRRQNVRGVAAQIAETVDALDLTGPLHVVGHSFGGGVALQLGATRPDLVASLNLICPVGGAGTGRVGPHRMAAGLLRDGLHPWTPRALADLVPNAVRNPLALTWSAYAAWSADLAETTRTVAGHGIATHFAFARHDGVVSPGLLGALGLPGVTAETVPGRHSWLLTDPARFAAGVVRRLPVFEPATAA